MTDLNDSARTEQEDPTEVKRKLAKRMMLAGGLIVFLLAALAAFDYLSRQEEEVEEDVPEVVVTAPTRTAPSEPKTNPADLPSPSAVASPEEPLPKPEISSPVGVNPAPPVSAPPAPSSSLVNPAVGPKPAIDLPTRSDAQPPVPVRTTTPPTAPVTPARITPPAPVAPVLPRPSAPAPQILPSEPEGTRSSVQALPSANPTVIRPPVLIGTFFPRPAPVVQRLAAGYVLQAGVFSSHERAEEMKTKLLKAGVPITIESRVQVGPFATQKEADAARAKIKALGVETLLIPPRISPANRR